MANLWGRFSVPHYLSLGSPNGRSMSLGLGSLGDWGGGSKWVGGWWCRRMSPGWIALEVNPRPGVLRQRQALLKVLQLCL